MINVVIDKRSDYCTLSVRGHANYCDGNDIVCAGISAIVQAFVGVVINSDVDHTYTMESGICEVTFGSGLDRELDMLTIGILQIERAYPKNVSLTFVREKR